MCSSVHLAQNKTSPVCSKICEAPDFVLVLNQQHLLIVLRFNFLWYQFFTFIPWWNLAPCSSMSSRFSGNTTHEDTKTASLVTLIHFQKVIHSLSIILCSPPTNKKPKTKLLTTCTNAADVVGFSFPLNPSSSINAFLNFSSTFFLNAITCRLFCPVTLAVQYLEHHN